MRVLITGCGLIGAYTAKELVDRGDEVTFFDLQPNLLTCKKFSAGSCRSFAAIFASCRR